MFDPAALSPRERVSYTDELKKSSGGNPIVDTAIDVLGNPLTWLAAATGYDDTEKLLETMFEQRQNNEEVFEAVNEAMKALRDTLPEK